MMAIRKKSETIHLRVKPISKALLEGLANAGEKTSTQIIEDLITDAAEKAGVRDIDDMIDDQFLEDGKLSLKNAVIAAHHLDEPILTLLRTYYIASEALSPRAKTIASTIIRFPEFFSGDTKIFSMSEGIIGSEFFSEIPKIDLKEISKRMTSLEDFSVFREKNPNWKSSYDVFLTMIGEE